MKLLEEYISLILNEEYSTKENKPIKFIVHEQDPTYKDDRGWVVHKIEAYIDSKIAGYIKISYIPYERMEKNFGTIVDWLANIKGELQLRNFYTQPISKQVINLYLANYNTYDNIERLVKTLSEKELINLRSKLLKSLKQKHKIKYREFKDFHVNKPLVDYIFVEDEFKRQRIGAALYEYAARWLAEKGMKLYASGLQSDSAKASWNWMKKEKPDNIGIEKPKNPTRPERTYLKY